MYKFGCFVFTLVLLSLNSCSTSKVALEGDYQDNPYQLISISGFEDTWMSVLAFMKENDIAVSKADKSAGVIITKRLSFSDFYSFEENGNLRDANAYIVLGRNGDLASRINVLSTEGVWNVDLSNVGPSGGTVSISLSDATAYGEKAGRGSRPFDLEIKSTGMFEKQVEKFIHNPDVLVSRGNSLASANDKSNVELEKEMKRLKELNTSLKSQQAELNAKEAELKTLESFVYQKEEDLQKREKALAAEKRKMRKDQGFDDRKSEAPIPTSTKSDPPAPNKPRSSNVTKPLVRIQFTAQGAGMSFPKLSHLGEIHTEKVPGRNLYRYQLKGNYDSKAIDNVIKELAKLGFPEAFVVR